MALRATATRIMPKLLYQMPDGTIKHINPITGTEVWTVSGRGSKPVTNLIPHRPTPLEKHVPEDYCNFCETNYLNTPPEKARLALCTV